MAERGYRSTRPMGEAWAGDRRDGLERHAIGDWCRIGETADDEADELRCLGRCQMERLDAAVGAPQAEVDEPVVEPPRDSQPDAPLIHCEQPADRKVTYDGLMLHPLHAPNRRAGMMHGATDTGSITIGHAERRGDQIDGDVGVRSRQIVRPTVSQHADSVAPADHTVGVDARLPGRNGCWVGSRSSKEG